MIRKFFTKQILQGSFERGTVEFALVQIHSNIEAGTFMTVDFADITLKNV